MYVVTGSTGKVGKYVVEELLSKGKKIKAIGRDVNKLRQLNDKGAITIAGDLNDINFTKKSFEKSEAVFCLIPPANNTYDYISYTRKFAKNFTEAIRDNKIKYAILLSSVGTETGEGLGLIDRLAVAEKIFSELRGVNILVVRAAFFMENLLQQIENVNLYSQITGIIRGDISFPMVSVVDVGRYVGKRMYNLNFKGHKVEYLLGPKNISLNQLTSIIAKTIKKPGLKYKQISPEEMMKIYISSFGLTENIAQGIIEMEESIDNGTYSKELKRNPENTTDTTFEDFAKMFAEEYFLHIV